MARQIRSFLAALLPLGCVLVVCDITNGPVTVEPGAQPYEIGLRCTDTGASSNAVVTAGVDEEGGFACNENSFFASDPVSNADVLFVTNEGGSSIELDCAYSSGVVLPDPFQCAGTFTYEVNWDSTGIQSRTLPNTLTVGLRAVALGGAPPGVLDVAGTIVCPGLAAADLPTDGTPVHFVDLLPVGTGHQGFCVVVIRLDSSVAAAGQSLHTVTLFASANPTQCGSNVDCPNGERCGPTGCQAGDAGESCQSSYAPVEPGLDLPPLGDCNETAPICATFFRCTDGAVGDGCRADTDCALGLHCTSVIFGTCAL